MIANTFVSNKLVFFNLLYSKKFKGRGGEASLCHLSSPGGEITLKNSQHKILKMKWGGQRPFGLFSEFYPFWRIQASVILFENYLHTGGKCFPTMRPFLLLHQL